MKRLFRIAFQALAIVFVTPIAHGQIAGAVDPFLGASGGGNVFPGPAVPFGMIKPGPDMINLHYGDPNAGWNANGDIAGFSQTHVSGTGGGAKYGNILVQPTTGAPAPLDSASPRADEHASVGLYSVALSRYAVHVDLTASRRAAMYRFQFSGDAAANLLFDVSHCLKSSGSEEQSIVTSEARVISPTAVAGSTSVTGGWNKQPNTYTVYFYAVTDTRAVSWGTWLGDKLRAGSEAVDGGAAEPSGAWLSFAPEHGRTVMMKIGISFVSIEQARRNLNEEMPAFDFGGTQQTAIAAWNHALSSVELKGETAEQKQIFYTALYHTMLMPTDRTGENPLWQSSEPYFDDYYAIWDIFRSSGPLLTLIAPEHETAVVRALVDLYRHEGWPPDARSGNYNGRTQGGSNAEFMITDAYVKGLKGIDRRRALAAEIHDAEVAPVDHFKEGRGSLSDWHTLGYVSNEGSDRPGSVSMEDAADDLRASLRESEHAITLPETRRCQQILRSPNG